MPDETLDAWIEDFADKASRPARARLAEVLATLTHADEALCKAVVAEGASDLLRAALSRHYAATELAYGGHTEPAEAWESAAPEGWVGDPQRGFMREEGISLDDPMPLTPSTLKAVLTFASDPEGMLTAEALAAEHIQRCVRLLPSVAMLRRTSTFPRGAKWPAALRHVWRAQPVGQMYSGWLRELEPRGDTPLGAALLKLSDGSSVTEDRAQYVAKRAMRLMAPKLSASATHAVMVATLHTRYAHLGAQNPFAPLVDLWKTGYALADHGSGMCVLNAPAL